MQVEMLPAHMIYARASARDVDKTRAAEIGESVREIGLLAPLIVRPDKVIRNGRSVDGWVILAGNHRFEALFRILNWREIPCQVMEADDLKAELVMIDENLRRSELSDALRAYQTARRKEIYEALHPETKSVTVRGGPGRGKNARQFGDRFSGGDGSANLAKPNGEAADRFTAATSKTTGRSERTVQREAERGEKLGTTLNRIAGTSLDKGVEIDALAALPHQEREDIVARAERGEKVSARKPEPRTTVVPLDTEDLRAKTLGRRLMREYLQAPRGAQRVFDELYAEATGENAQGTA